MRIQEKEWLNFNVYILARIMRIHICKRMKLAAGAKAKGKGKRNRPELAARKN
jgi:hypothetical protein